MRDFLQNAINLVLQLIEEHKSRGDPRDAADSDLIAICDAFNVNHL